MALRVAARRVVIGNLSGRTGSLYGRAVNVTTSYTRRFSSQVALLTDLKSEVERFDPAVSVSAAHTPPGSWYVRPDLYEVEKSSVFGKNWIAVPGGSQLTQPGRFITGTLGDEPYIIVKDKSGQLRYFYNICRHHGTLLCDEKQGQTEEFVCPYHAWKYALDGRLTMARKLRNIENFTAKNNSLNKLSGVNWFDILFLNQNTTAEESELINKLEGLKSDLHSINCYEDNLQQVGSRTFYLDCNWKVVIDNYLDGGYHVPICHTSLNSLLEETSYQSKAYDGYSIQTSQGLDEESRVGEQLLFAHIYPNVFLNRYGNWLDVNYVLPTGAETCEVVFDWFYDKDKYESMRKGDRSVTVQTGIKHSEKVQDEDTVICERVQKGMRSRSFQFGRYAPLVEHLMHDFHCNLHKDYMSYINRP